jgi:acyl-coenzyme A thioesterase PaaI-like protein
MVSKKIKYQPHSKLVKKIKEIPLIQRLESEHHMEPREFSPHYMPESHFIRGTLHQKGGIEYAHSHFSKSQQCLFVVMKLGDRVVGHPGITHGGLIAGIFDDIFGEIFYSVADGKYMGFTASLKIDYRQKMPSNQVVLFCARVTRRDKRKVYIQGEARNCHSEDISFSGSNMYDQITKMNQTLYAECEALFIIPRENYAQYLASLE